MVKRKQMFNYTLLRVLIRVPRIIIISQPLFKPSCRY